MAKKKTTHQSHDHKQQAPQPHSHHPTPPPHGNTITMDDPSAQIQNLKNLNSMLLKETTEGRQQIESLVEAKEALQSELNRSAMAGKVLENRFSEAAEKNVVLELENGVLFVFVETQMREMGFRFDRLVRERNEIERVVAERDSEVAVFSREAKELTLRLENERLQFNRLSQERARMKNELDGLLAESKRLNERLLETENREGKLREEVEKLRLEGEKLMVEGCEKERAIGELKKERDLALRSTEGSAKVIDQLKEDIGGVIREKNEIEKLKNAQELKIIGFELELKQLNGSLKNSRNEGALMRAKILELEGSLGLAMEKEEEMAMEIRALLKEKKEMEKSIEMLTERRDSIKKVLDMVQKELEEKQRQIDETVRVRDEIEQVKVSRENEIVELQGEVDQLRDVVHKLEESCREFGEKNMQLISEANHYRNYVDEVILEKDNISKGFDEEKSKVENLMLQVAGMEGKIEQAAAELGQMRSEGEKLINRNKMMENRVGVLVNEKEVLQRSLLEAQRESDDSRAKIEFSCINSNQALAMLKDTAAMVCQCKDSVEEVVSNEKKLEEEIQPYAEELDAIRNAFKSKDEMVDDMKKQLVSLQKSVADAHKSKSLWTVISFTTTIFAAALAAYVARGR